MYAESTLPDLTLNIDVWTGAGTRSRIIMGKSWKLRVIDGPLLVDYIPEAKYYIRYCDRTRPSLYSNPVTRLRKVLDVV